MSGLRGGGWMDQDQLLANTLILRMCVFSLHLTFLSFRVYKQFSLGILLPDSSFENMPASASLTILVHEEQSEVASCAQWPYHGYS